MPSKYKLNYLNGRGIGEPIRFLLAYSNINFEDNRINYLEDWPKIKPSTPFGKVPLLEIDDKKYSQSVPLYRYLGKNAKLGGNNDLEDLHIDIIADVLTDLRYACGQAYWHTPNEDKNKKTVVETFEKETVPFTYKKLEEIAKQNGGYLANNKLSWADFMFASTAENMDFMAPKANFLKDYPTLKALQDKILGIPQIKAYIATRPDTIF